MKTILVLSLALISGLSYGQEVDELRPCVPTRSDRDDGNADDADAEEGEN